MGKFIKNRMENLSKIELNNINGGCYQHGMGIQPIIDAWDSFVESVSAGFNQAMLDYQNYK